MNQKEAIFFTRHLVEYASKRLNVSTGQLYRLASYVSHVGRFSTIDSLKKIANSDNDHSVKVLLDNLKSDDDESADEVDEGKLNHHLYFPDFVENHTNEPSQVNDFGGFSVPEGFVP